MSESLNRRFAGSLFSQLQRRPLPLLALVAALEMLVCLLYAQGAGVAPGFPLDDSWIHQTYARNLALHGEFAYVPGQPSAGSTAPAWTLLLSLGYALGLPYHLWTLFLGWLSLAGAGWGAWRLFQRLWPGHPTLSLAAGLTVCLEWHMLWAALSGMETALFTALLLHLLASGMDEPPAFLRALALGLLGGLLTLARPEGVLLVGLIGLEMAIRTWRSRRSLRSLLPAWAGLAMGAALLLVPYLIANLRLSGAPFPNTFYAKQVEYRALLESGSLLARCSRVLAPTLVGMSALLVPGFLWSLWLSLRRLWQRDGTPASALPALYWGVYVLIYAARLAVDYQHGRYLMPTIPLLIVLGLGGTASLLEGIRSEGWRRLAARAVALACGLLLLGFVGLGATAYTTDVRYINDEMVATAFWLQEHTQPAEVIAVHDIGAVGYFTERPLIDLAGLITPELIPILRDEPALLHYLLQGPASYLVAFPAWYPELVQSPTLELVYQTPSNSTRRLGLYNMAVYRIQR